MENNDNKLANMSDRFPPVPPAQQTEEQAKAHQLMKAISEKSFDTSKFKIVDDDGALLGPWAFMLHIPTLAPPFVGIAGAVLGFPHLNIRLRELAILAVANVFQAPYTLYAHKAISLAPPANFEPDQVEDAANGKTPKGLTDVEAAVYEFAWEVASTKGPVKESVWKKAEEKASRDVLKEVVGVVGAFGFSCLVMNGVGVGVPEGV